MNKLSMCIVALLCVLASSCKKDDPSFNQGVNPQPTANLDLGSSINADFMGRVTDKIGNPIEGATVSISGNSTATDENGVFSFKNVSSDEKLAFVKVEKQGYFKSGRSLIPSTSTTNLANVVLIERELAGTLSPGEETTLSLSSGAGVAFKGRYVTASGETYQGDVSVYMTYLDPSAEETFFEMPGMLYAQNSNDEAGILTTYGMIGVELVGEQNQELQIAEGSSATIYVPIEAGQSSHASDEIPLWFFDDEAGYWIEQGKAVAENGFYVGEVEHFTFWNCDKFNDAVTLEGYSISTNGDTLGGTEMVITAGTFSTAGYTNSDGSYFTYIPANELIEFSGTNVCGASSILGSTGPYGSGSTNYYDVLVNQVDINLVVVKGNLVDCGGNPVTDGFVLVNTVYQTAFASVSSGGFSIPVYDCANSDSLSVFGLDYIGGENSGTINFAVTSPATFVGDVMACGGALPEILSYSIDGNPSVVYDMNIACKEFDVSGTPYFEIFPQADTSIYISGETQAIGSSNFSFPNGGAIEVYPSGFDTNAPYNIDVTFNNYGAPGEQVSLNFTGTWTDVQGNSHTLSGFLVVIRDV